MANDVVLGAAMRSNLLSLQSTQRSIDATQLRLATGKKVNSALDNPQSFFQAQSLNNRASDLTRLLDGIGQSIRTIEEADKGITALTRLVEQASSIAEEAMADARAAEGFAQFRSNNDLRAIGVLQDGTVISGTSNQFTLSFHKNNESGAPTTADIQVIIGAGDTVDNIVANINSNTAINENVRASVTSGGQLKFESLKEGGYVRISSGAANSLNAGGFAKLGLNEFVGTEGAGAASRIGSTAVAGRTIVSEVSAAPQTNGKYTASSTLLAAGFFDGSTAAATVDLHLVVDDAVSSAITVAETDTIQTVLDGINTDSTLSAQGIRASLNETTGRIEITVGDQVGSVEFRATNASVAAAQNVSFGFGSGAADGAVATATDVQSEKFTFIGSSADLERYQSDYNKIRDQIDGIVKDAHYRGVNLLSGDALTTVFNEDRSSTLRTEGQDLTALGLGLTKANFATVADIQGTIDSVRGALENVRSFGIAIANDLSIIQTRRDFTEQTINTLKAGASDLTDADLNEEGATLLALQTAQQLGVTSLSLASQSQQSVLRLF
ncbi:MAG: flagellin [Micavibrio sp.]